MKLEKYMKYRQPGIFTIRLRTCDSSILRYLLSPLVRFVWIKDYQPNPYLEWWRADVPLTKSEYSLDISVRSLRFDLLLEYPYFMDILGHFISQGLELYQLSKPVPDTLTMHGISRDNRMQILLENDVKTGFYLPHANEEATFWSNDREIIKYALSFKEVTGFCKRVDDEVDGQR